MNPHEQFVRGLFNRIAARYDLLNRVISLRLDTLWRKRLIRALGLNGTGQRVLDLGTGTGDLAQAAARELGVKGAVIGLDFSAQMIRLAAEKKRRCRNGEKVKYILGSALTPPFRDGVFDAVMTAFVLRNVADLDRLFHEAYRLLRPRGKIASLDMFPPTCAPFSFFYSLYFYRLVPWIGACLARDRAAYRYLSDSVKTFHSPDRVVQLIQNAGFRQVQVRRFLKGAVCLHTGEKPPD